MQVPRWRNLLIFRSSLCQFSHSASFHSTPASLEKWKNKWKPNYVRYATRQKRADAKKALKDLLFKSGCSRFSFQDDGQTWNTNRRNKNSCSEGETDFSHGFTKQSRSRKSSAKAAPYRSSHARKGKLRRDSFSDDFDEHPETIFQATFGSRCFTWSFRPWDESHFQYSTPGFEWRDHADWTRNRSEEWDTTSETDDDNEPCVIGSYSDRKILGLPPTGPLKIEDVKSAFRLSALKWHPDKHQGPSQVMAEEKFKLCVNAYKSLCNALSSA
ncbi:PREDICTED: uncharacterized protein LOC104586235 isoform X2 [Nelumbo nucifera]|uniref:Uncharacterized protein LOC104586235 isoform X2 n=1 Tax=Nelumbo nucifera TaxID=4432 RepID=A0A1U7YRT0_NELNU|nr:PREDICTED: uncharacterized protein LOC104586235 isoform X2 [Nelumbo nucifera]